ncbi:unnamed protein product, partial [Heterotrigona itama]
IKEQIAEEHILSREIILRRQENITVQKIQENVPIFSNKSNFSPHLSHSVKSDHFSIQQIRKWNLPLDDTVSCHRYIVLSRDSASSTDFRIVRVIAPTRFSNPSRVYKQATSFPYYTIV